MRTKYTKSLPNRDETLNRNTKIDARIVAAHERLEQELKRLGVEIKPSYKLNSPWRRDRARIHNRSRLAIDDSGGDFFRRIPKRSA